ncbi:uncharacterized protein LOC133176852 [Saccostrea echinata]|uniref:uncharacterized protein LOC133176852 n=1 Tax=Saccostrea echinata TaxID=191078 RepID=UPI002A80D8FE|nr:uncharacterized protein LOC133176852 [Saccostrea echinata]
MFFESLYLLIANSLLDINITIKKISFVPLVGVTAAAVLLIAAVSGFVIYKKRSGKDINSNQEKHLHKEADSKGYKSNDSEVEDILLEKGDTFKSLSQEKITSHDPLHRGFFSKTGQKDTPYIPSTHDKIFTPEEERPLFIDYTSKSIRQFSFSGFSPQEIVDNLASAGFFYAGYESSTACFHCGCKKDDWKLGDDAIFEHLRLNSKCSFARDIENSRKQANLNLIKET